MLENRNLIVFIQQPLLVEHFEYEELKILKEVVLKEHELVKELQGGEKGQREEQREGETCPDVKDLRDLDYLHLEELGESCLLSDGLEEQDEEEKEEQEEEIDNYSTDRLCMEGNDWKTHCNLDDKQSNRTVLYRDQPCLQNISWGLQRLDLTDEGLDWQNDTQELYSTTQCRQNIEHQWNDNHASANHENSPEWLSRQEEWIFSQESAGCQSSDKWLNGQQLTSQPEVRQVATPTLPVEVLVEIFRYLTPPDLCRCAQVSLAWNAAAFAPCLWSSLYPVQWARGQ